MLKKQMAQERTMRLQMEALQRRIVEAEAAAAARVIGTEEKVEEVTTEPIRFPEKRLFLTEDEG